MQQITITPRREAAGGPGYCPMAACPPADDLDQPLRGAACHDLAVRYALALLSPSAFLSPLLPS